MSNNNTNNGIGSLPTNAGSDNTAYGAYTMYETSVGDRNTTCGVNSLYYNQASDNTGIGAGALYTNTIGEENTALGVSALGGGLAQLAETVGDRNTAVGKDALYENHGDDNVAFGHGAGSTNDTGSRNTFIGKDANADDTNYNDSTAIGAGATVTGSNEIVLGTSSETTKIPGILDVSGNITATGTVACNTTLQVTGSSYQAGDVFQYASTAITANLQVGGDLTVNGAVKGVFTTPSYQENVVPSIGGGGTISGDPAMIITAITVGGITTLSWPGTGPGLVGVSTGDVTSLTYEIPSELSPLNPFNFYPCLIESNGAIVYAEYQIGGGTIEFTGLNGGAGGPFFNGTNNQLVAQSVSYINANVTTA